MKLSYSGIAHRAAVSGLALRGGFHAGPDDEMQAATVLMLGWTGGTQWPVFVASPEYADAAPHPLDRWSRRIIDGLAAELGAKALFPFDPPPFLPFLQWAIRAEPVHPSPLGILVHPDWGLWHAWRGALAFVEKLDLPPRDMRASPCDSCTGQPCTSAGSFETARRACPIGTPYGDTQAGFHMAAFHTTVSSGKSSPD